MKKNHDLITNIIIDILKNLYEPVCALEYNSEFELLAATILSAQCTDERVNSVTKTLFKKYRKLDDYVNADIIEFEQDIKPTGFYKNKAKSILNSAKIIKEKYNGKIPDDINELIKLPGVGRKTANVVLGSAFGITSGIVVDTHVKRLSNRIGLSKNSDPEKIENDLIKITEKKNWIILSHLLIHHGRKICSARKPLCRDCKIQKYCKKNI
ncbi:endonuclease III [Candidatus Dependentiae bacterium]|nr:endonuclease III [Candidatus Dependentiae bacterium]